MVEGCVKNPLQTPTTRKSAPLVATAPEFVPLSAQKNEKQAQNQENLKSKSSSSLPAASTKKYAPVFAKKVVPVVSPEPTFVISLKPDPNASVEESLRTVAEYNRKYPNSARAQIYAQMLGPETVLPPIREPKPTPQKPKPAPQNTKPNFLRALQDPAIADKVGLSLSDPQNPYTSKNQSNSKKAGRRLVDVWFSNHSRPDEQSTTPMMDDSDESDPYSPGPVPFDIQTLPIVNKPQIRLNPAEAGRKVVDQWLPNVPHPKEERVICMHDSREDRESQIELANQPNSLPASSINPLVSQNEEANGGRYIQAFQKW
ncbi:hypothetical protein N7466_009162 [Penicillium verhagenii]|uniref:uncharacterized protein n=1 Tax=Penicillium verhagenii TaxID=1562060 RepID=UPI0025459249|nr:uncharacterized protein N7466_009162 [Penicillium verhagenii]KAJ5920836.1 hypothetical protein N7466_009162 [Penicillium verhagenii]